MIEQGGTAQVFALSIFPTSTCSSVNAQERWGLLLYVAGRHRVVALNPALWQARPLVTRAGT